MRERRLRLLLRFPARCFCEALLLLPAVLGDVHAATAGTCAAAATATGNAQGGILVEVGEIFDLEGLGIQCPQLFWQTGLALVFYLELFIHVASSLL
jgi:hypothetical protein